MDGTDMPCSDRPSKAGGDEEVIVKYPSCKRRQQSSEIIYLSPFETHQSLLCATKA